MPDYVVLTGRRLIDGTGNKPIEDPVIIIHGAQIADVGRQGRVVLPQADNILRLDYQDGTLLPGLIDCHAHICLSADDNPRARLYEDSDDMLLLRAAKNVRLAFKTGVTTLRDCGGRNRVTFSIKEGIEKKIILGPRLLLCGRPLTITGGHFFYMNGEADGVDGVRRACRQLIKEGADFLKVMASGGGMTPSTISKLPYYTPEELLAATEEAHRLGRRVAAHCHSTQSIKDAIDAGIDTIEHASFLASDGQRRFDPFIAEQIIAKGMYICPTLPVGRTPMKKHGPGKEYPLKLHEDMKNSNFSFLHKMGVKLIAGTDAGIRYSAFDHYPFCLELAVAGGMTNMQAIQSATGLAAEALSISDVVGTIQPGKEADILVVDGDPLEDIRALWNTRMVMKAGEPFHDADESGIQSE